MIRKLMWAVLVVGVALLVTPFAIGLPGRAAGGERMIDAFEPIMDEGNVQLTADYYYDVFVPLGDVVPAMSQENIDRFNGYVAGFAALGMDAEQMVPALSAAMGMPESDVQAYMASEFPAMSAMLQNLPAMESDFTGLLGLMGSNVTIFERVPAGLDHYEPLVTTMQEQRGNYDDVAGLPDFRLFTWFFVVPGALLVVIALVGLFAGRRSPDTATVARPIDEPGLVSVS
jgi:hypothetical protein